jgi:H+-transporting ATPase
MLITLLNDGTLITIAYDHATASDTPNRWNLPALFLISSTLGVVSCCSSLLLLYFLLDSWNPNGFFQGVGMSGFQYGQITTAIYLKVSVSDFLTLFSARTGPKFFFQVKPAPMLLGGCCVALGLSSLLALFWPDTTTDGILVEGLKSSPGLFVFVWLYSIFFWFVQDLLKVLAFMWMYHTNFNKISTTGVVVLPETALKMLAELDKALTEGGMSSGRH